MPPEPTMAFQVEIKRKIPINKEKCMGKFKSFDARDHINIEFTTERELIVFLIVPRYFKS